MKGYAKLPETIRSLSRFPIPVAIATVLAVLLNLQEAGVTKLSSTLESELIYASAGAFLASFAAHLWAISSKVSTTLNLAAALTVAALAAIIQHFHGSLDSQNLITLLGLFLLTMAAPYLRSRVTMEAFWRFNLQLGIAVAMALLAFLIVCGGFSLILASLAFLFNFSFGRLYGHIWTTGVALFAPLFAASMVPSDFEEPFTLSSHPDLLEKAVTTVLNLALIPLILIYSAVLHTYAAKIALYRSLPKGEIGWMVLAFGAIGTVSYMVAYPWREVGYRPLRWLMRSWFWLMIVPTTLLVLAVQQRIGEYGVTPERYCLVLFALWLATSVAYLGAVRGRMDLRVIPASLGVGLIVSSVGPWGAAAVSVRSQLGQLQQVLSEKHLLDQGILRLDPPRMKTFQSVEATNKRVASIVKALYDLDALDRLATMFANVTDSPFLKPQDAEARFAAFGFSRWGTPPEPPPKSLPAPVGISIDTGIYSRMIGPFWIEQDGLEGCDALCPMSSDLRIAGVPLEFSSTSLTAGGSGATVSFDLNPLIRPQPVSGKPAPLVMLEAREGRDRALLIAIRPPLGTSPPDTHFATWLLLKSPSVAAK